MKRNDRLRGVMHARRMSPAQLAERLGVDQKTVARWLSGRTPYTVNRAAVADVLDVDETYLWPEAADGVVEEDGLPAEVAALYSHRGMVPPALWPSQVRGARECVDLLVYAGLFWLDAHPEMVDLLAERAHAGVKVRLAFGDPDSTAVAARGVEEGSDMAARVRMSLGLVAPIVGRPGVEVRVHDAPLYTSIYRADGVLLANHHLYGCPAAQAPVCQVLQVPGGWMFDRYMRAFEKAWAIGRPLSRGEGDPAWPARTTTTTPTPPPPTASSPPPSAA